jgi:Uma2 family endonuclease
VAAGTLPRMALMVGDSPVHLLTADEVLRMAEAGMLGEDTRHIELLHGVLVDRMDMTPPHSFMTMRLNTWLVRGLDPDSYCVSPGGPIIVADPHSMPQPDLYVVEAELDVNQHPRGALLVLEVSVSSLRTDLNVKSALYAATGIPEYWVIDVAKRRLVVFTEPAPDGYGRRAEHTTGEVAPRDLTIAPLDLATLFAGLK